jgi:hypothetical protein
MFMKLNHFFSSLSWHITENGVKYPIFSQEEILNVPLKWLKHELLVHIGLRDIRELRNEIYRFDMSIEGLLLARKMCVDLFYGSNKEPILIVLKIIFPEQTMDLPNYRITSEKQIRKIFEVIELTYFDTVDELWLCKSNISLSKSNFGGRISFRLDRKFVNDELEMVWFTSPRMIDEHRSMGFPYLKASKSPGCLSFSVESIYIPERFGKEQFESQVIDDYRSVLLELYNLREQINAFIEILCGSSVTELVLEFKMDAGHFKIIDWDTDIEARALFQ